jgi:hypothetical protein
VKLETSTNDSGEPDTGAGLGVTAAPSMTGAAPPFTVVPVEVGVPIPVPLPLMITGRATVPTAVKPEVRTGCPEVGTNDSGFVPGGETGASVPLIPKPVGTFSP